MKRKLRLNNGFTINSPTDYQSRPTSSIVREAILNITAHNIVGSSWLDVFGGIGALSCEVLHFGAIRLLTIEKNFKTFKICKSNINEIIQKMNYNDRQLMVKVLYNDSLEVLSKKPKPFSNLDEEFRKYQKNVFDYVFIDPPYELDNLVGLVLKKISSNNWLFSKGKIIVEFSKRKKPNINYLDWSIESERYYGDTGLMVLTPNQS